MLLICHKLIKKSKRGASLQEKNSHMQYTLISIYVDIQAHWGKFDREEKQQKRAKEKVALEQRKLNIDMLEAKRQQRKLNFLLTNRTVCPFHGQEYGTPVGGKLTIKLKLNLANIIICCQETEEGILGCLDSDVKEERLRGMDNYDEARVKGRARVGASRVVDRHEATKAVHNRAVVGEKFGLSMSEAAGDSFGC